MSSKKKKSLKFLLLLFKFFISFNFVFFLKFQLEHISMVDKIKNRMIPMMIPMSTIIQVNFNKEIKYTMLPKSLGNSKSYQVIFVTFFM